MLFSSKTRKDRLQHNVVNIVDCLFFNPTRKNEKKSFCFSDFAFTLQRPLVLFFPPWTKLILKIKRYNSYEKGRIQLSTGRREDYKNNHLIKLTLAKTMMVRPMDVVKVVVVKIQINVVQNYLPITTYISIS